MWCVLTEVRNWTLSDGFHPIHEHKCTLKSTKLVYYVPKFLNLAHSPSVTKLVFQKQRRVEGNAFSIYLLLLTWTWGNLWDIRWSQFYTSWWNNTHCFLPPGNQPKHAPFYRWDIHSVRSYLRTAMQHRTESGFPQLELIAMTNAKGHGSTGGELLCVYCMCTFFKAPHQMNCESNPDGERRRNDFTSRNRTQTLNMGIMQRNGE